MCELELSLEVGTAREKAWRVRGLKEHCRHLKSNVLPAKRVEWMPRFGSLTSHSVSLASGTDNMGSLEQPKRNFAYSIYVYKKADQDEQSHHNHIESVNTPIIKPLLEKYGAVSYTVAC